MHFISPDVYPILLPKLCSYFRSQQSSIMKRLSIIALVLLLGAGCKQLYVPSPVNSPLFSQAGEMSGQLALSTNGYNIQGAWSPVYHLGIIGGGNLFSIQVDSLDQPDQFRHRYAEIGGGYYTRLSKYARFELYAGYGGGHTGDVNNRGYFQKFFLQPGIGYSGRYVDIGFSPRISSVQHLRTLVLGQRRNEDRQSVFFEPWLTFRAGMEQFKFSFQMGWAIRSGGDFVDDDFRRGGNFTLGMHLIFGKDFE